MSIPRSSRSMVRLPADDAPPPRPGPWPLCAFLSTSRSRVGASTTLLLLGRLRRFSRLSAGVQLPTQLVTLPFGLFSSPALLCHPLLQRGLRCLAASPLSTEFVLGLFYRLRGVCGLSFARGLQLRRHPLYQPGDDPPRLGVGLALGLQLLAEVGDLTLHLGCERVGLTWLVGWWLVTAKHDEHPTTVTHGRERPTPYATPDGVLGDAQSIGGLGYGHAWPGRLIGRGLVAARPADVPHHGAC
jgi:hypothetical protein